MANPEIANLWSEYQMILDEFKEAHKNHTDSRRESDQFKELKNDIGIIDAEKENGIMSIQCKYGLCYLPWIPWI